MIDEKNKGIGNLLAEYQPPVRTPKVETQEDPMLSLGEALMRLGPLELPKSTTPVVKKETRDGYQDQYNKYFNKKSDQYYKNQQPKKKIGALSYVNKMVDIYEGPKIDPPVLKNNINDRYVNKTLNKFENRTDNKDTVTFNATTQLFTNENRNIAFKDYNQAKAWNDSLNKERTNRKQKDQPQPNKNRRLI